MAIYLPKLSYKINKCRDEKRSLSKIACKRKKASPKSKKKRVQLFAAEKTHLAEKIHANLHPTHVQKKWDRKSCEAVIAFAAVSANKKKAKREKEWSEAEWRGRG